MWFVVVSGLFFPIMTGLVLAAVVGIFRMASAFTAFRTSVDLRLDNNDRQHKDIFKRIDKVGTDLNEHAAEEMEEIRAKFEAMKGGRRETT